MRKSMVLVISLGLLLLGSIAYVRGQGSAEQGIGKAIAVVSPTQGSKVKGIVTFTKVDNGIKVVADLEGLGAARDGKGDQRRRPQGRRFGERGQRMHAAPGCPGWTALQMEGRIFWNLGFHGAYQPKKAKTPS